jgi:peptidoglycan hydrolase-like protein with peptidoglycan-binding domain
MPAIDKVLFARFCLIQADFCGVNPHYLVAIAQLRSQINDDVVDGRVGPYRFTQAEWDLNRHNPEYEPDFESRHISNWRLQCSYFGRMVDNALTAFKAANGGRMPSTLELYAAQLGVAPADTAAQERLAADLQEAINDTRDAVRRAEAESLPDVDAPAKPDVPPEMILFRRVPGLAPVRGHLIARMQQALIERGHLPAVNASNKSNKDGVLGPTTESALEAWQAAVGHASTGALTHGEWRELTGLEPPDIYERCAQLTGAFEGTGFGGTNPTDFDQTVLTFGYHGYTISGGNLQVFLKEFDATHPGFLDQVFGSEKAAALRTLFPPVSQAKSVERARDLFLTGERVKDDWRDVFQAFGESPEGQQCQLAFSRKVYWRDAETMRAILKFSEPLGSALCFDVSVQNGLKKQFAQDVAGVGTTGDEMTRRVRFGEKVASGARPQFQDDVRQRKVATLARGAGTVHGGEYRLDNWGFADAESAETGDPVGSIPSIEVNSDFAAFFVSKFPGLTAFSASEFLVKGGKNASNHLNTDPPEILWPNIVPTVRVLLELKKRLGNPAITLNSVYRSRAYNASVGGARDSQHMKFTAVDLVAGDGRGPSSWARTLHQMRDEGVFAGGIGLYNTFVHVDTRGHNADWG